MRPAPDPALPTRRSLLRWVSTAALLGAAGPFVAPWIATRAARASGGGGGRKLLTIFLRGGNDGLNTLIPLHDVQYFAPQVRPTLRIPAGQALDLGLGGAALHPKLARVLEVFDAGELAVVGRVGYANSSLSHFSSQHFLETAVPGDEELGEGWVARWARLQAPGAALAAASVSPQMQRAYLGPQVVAHVPDLAEYALSSQPITNKILGAGASGLAAAYAAPAGAAYDGLVRDTGLAMADSLAQLASLPPATFASDAFPATPAACAADGLPGQWWAAAFLAGLRDALRILQGSPCAIAGVELPGFDHHVAQGGVDGDHAARLLVLAHGLRSLRRECVAAGDWDDFAVLVVSEFGRSSRENGGGGTDHGRAGVSLLAGGGVLGGVHHCDPVAWPSGATLFSADGKYVAHRTDYRAIYAEVLARHFGLGPAAIDAIVPGFSSLNGSEFQPLGLFV